MLKLIMITVIFILLGNNYYAQYKISGYINSESQNKKIYLSLLKYNEENAIYSGQVLTYSYADKEGYFEFKGNLLPDESKLYRIHVNKKEEGNLLDFIEKGPNKNYHNFIFSNNDTIFFPLGQKIIFNNSINTNTPDQEWRNSLLFENELLGEYLLNKNKENQESATNFYLIEYKKYCSNYIQNPLVKLLAFRHFKVRAENLNEDFLINPEFYYSIADELNEYYNGKSYYEQYMEDLFKLETPLIKEKYIFHKNLNFLLGIVILIIIFVYFYNRKMSSQLDKTDLSNLTEQEKKIAALIAKGNSNKEIANKLFISLSTVKSHVTSINRKLKTSDRRELSKLFKNQTGD